MSGRGSLARFARQYAAAKGLEAVAPVKPPPVTGDRFKKRRNLEGEFSLMLRAHGIDGFAIQHRFHPARRWAFDFAWIAGRFAVEIDGGVFQSTRTGHTSQTGIRRDYEKDTAALLLGWRVFRITDEMITQQVTIDVVRKYVGDGSGEAVVATQTEMKMQGAS